MSKKVMIIGTGNVGMSYAYALINQRIGVDELYLVDINKASAQGNAIDLRDCLAFTPGSMKIRTGTYQDAKDMDIIVITAGLPQQPGETRLDLIDKNAAIFKPMVTEIMASGFQGIFIVVTNPVDIMTYLTWKYSGLPRAQVIGSGTVLDSARLKYLIGHQSKVDPRSVNAWIIGEHGDSEFLVSSQADIGLESLRDFLSPEELAAIEDKVRGVAYEIIQKKGATYYGIGVALTRITSAIINNENAVLPVSNWDPFARIYYGYPAVLGRTGVTRRVALSLSAPEQRKLERSISIIKEALTSLK
ncbi:L-lactate dehydrogenase [Christensenellaceae bacterium OttesenSCG-928-L17]|nr:L-lactate dehydrogenase [Christensenellaceae bacterium OttesenSCG-928-L17]